MYNNESVTYLNHIVYNHFDYCNHMNGPNIDGKKGNSTYYCDILQPDGDCNYDSRRTSHQIPSSNFTT